MINLHDMEYYIIIDIYINYYIIVFFFLFLDANEDVIGPEGMEKFCEDIGVEPENVSQLEVHETNYVIFRQTPGNITDCIDYRRR